MKQITITMHRNGIIVNEEIYYINNMDFFVKDSIEEYVQSLKDMYIADGIGNIEFSIEIVDISVIDNYDLVKYLKGKTKYNKDKCYVGIALGATYYEYRDDYFWIDGKNNYVLMFEGVPYQIGASLTSGEISAIGIELLDGRIITATSVSDIKNLEVYYE